MTTFRDDIASPKFSKLLEEAGFVGHTNFPILRRADGIFFVGSEDDLKNLSSSGDIFICNGFTATDIEKYLPPSLLQYGENYALIYDSGVSHKNDFMGYKSISDKWLIQAKGNSIDKYAEILYEAYKMGFIKPPNAGN